MIADLIKDAERMNVPDMPLLARAAHRAFGFDPEEQYDIATEAWVYAARTFDPAVAKWSTYFYTTCDLIRRRNWHKRTFRQSTGIKIVHGIDPEVSFIESLPAPQAPEVNDNLERIMREVRKLAPRTAAIVIARFGLDGKPARTMDYIAAKLGLSRQRIKQILVEAFDEIRESLRECL